MRLSPKAALGIGVLVATLAVGTSAHAYLASFTVDKCLSSKIKTITKGASAYASCHAKDSAKPDPAKLATCQSKTSGKNTSAFAKLDIKYPACTGGTGDGPARDTDAATYADDLNADVGDAVGKCDAAKQKCVGKYVAAIGGCYAKAAGKAPGLVDSTCTGKAATKLADGVKGCLDKAAGKVDCTNAGSQAAALKSAADLHIDAQACALDPTNPGCGGPTPTATPGAPTPTVTATPGAGACGNGLNDPGEKCDASAPSAGWAVCGSDFVCTACNCACPGTIKFSGDAADPATILDTGWNGIAHNAKVISNGDVTVQLSCGASSRPCGVCTVSGPVANSGAGELRNERCSGDTSVQCTSAPGGVAGCGGPLGTCEFFFGGPLPLVAGGVGTCVVNQFNGAVSGTANVETGSAVTVANLLSRVHSSPSTDTPCATCVGDGTINDGVLGGTCSGGPRNGLACDASGAVPDRPDYGATSLDCPPTSASIIATLPIDLSNSTGTVSKAVTASSPNCSGVTGPKCVCDTCNNAAAGPCDSNADCPISGGNPGICGGRRCLGGTNDGGPCGGAGGGASACPGGGSCGRPGQPTAPNACVDQTAIPGSGTVCMDTAPVGDNRGECPEGPLTGVCSVASGHAQRSCGNANECCDDPPLCAGDPAVPGDCIISNRLCFLDNGLGGSIEADGLADPPVQDTSDPTLAAVFCIAPTSLPAVNAAAGLPGPGRTLLKGTASGHP
jgi:hypothetical protein